MNSGHTTHGDSDPAGQLGNPRHAFDAAVDLVAESPGDYRGETSPAYANMVGPFGGITAATMLNAACIHPARLGDPVSLTVNFAGAVADGPFRIAARPVRTNRATQHWSIELSQDGAVATTATAVFAIRRQTWSATEALRPDLQPPAPRAAAPASPFRVAWVRNYDMQFVQGAFPDPKRAQVSNDSVTSLWVRDEPPRPLDHLSLAAICDVFFPRIYLRRPKFAAAGTVSLTICFHADREAFARQGALPVFGTARAQRFHGGFFDQTAEIWGEGGALLASSHQIVYFKD